MILDGKCPCCMEPSCIELPEVIAAECHSVGTSSLSPNLASRPARSCFLPDPHSHAIDLSHTPVFPHSETMFYIMEGWNFSPGSPEFKNRTQQHLIDVANLETLGLRNEYSDPLKQLFLIN